MKHAGSPVARRRAGRLIVPSIVLASLAAAALAFQQTASSAVSSVSSAEHLSASLPARASNGLRKLDSHLAGLAGSSEGGSSTVPGWLDESARPTAGGKVLVDVTTDRAGAVRSVISRLGGRVQVSFNGVVEALVPKASLGALSRSSGVEFVRPPLHSALDAVPGEEVQASAAAGLQAQGITGKGTKVAIIDESFAGLAQRQAGGDLPANVVTQDMCGGQFGQGEGHGTAVAEIVHEMAPAAQLYLICYDSFASLVGAESYVKSQGVQIVNFSIEYFNAGRGTGDASDPVDAVVADARANGILWVNSAGNDAYTHWAGTFTSADGDKWLDFAPGDEGNTFSVPNGLGFCGFMKWDEWPNAQSDFDLVLADASTNQVIASSNNVQSGSQPPTEFLCVQNNTGSSQILYWAIYANHITGSPRIDLISTPIPPPYLQYQTPAGSIGDPASSPAAFAVGAVCWQNNALEGYSSQGPAADGRIKPDIAGHDSVSSATFGSFNGSCPSGFAGTSASSPEVAGAAALVKQANPGFTAAQIEQFLQQNAIDLGPTGADNQFGAGALHLPAAATKVDTTPPKVKALASKGVRGHLVKLVSRLFDDSGAVKLREQVKQNGHVIKTFTTGFVSTPKAETGYLNWLAPKHIKGTITHCDRGQDRAGHLSPVSCARVTLTG